MNWFKQSQNNINTYYHVFENHIFDDNKDILSNIMRDGLNSPIGQYITNDINFAYAMKQQMDEEGGGDFYGVILKIYLTPEQEQKLQIAPQKGEPDGLLLPENILPSQIKVLKL